MNKGIWAILPAIAIVIAMGATFSTQTTSDVEAATASTAMFMNIEGIPGESTDDNHKDWIEVESFSSGIINPTGGFVQSGDAGARTTGPVNHNDFSVVKVIDKATPRFHVNCCDGTHFNEIEFELCSTTKDKQCYMKYLFTDAIITSISTGGSSGDSKPVEEVTFSYGKIEWTYTQTDLNSGKPTGEFTAHWDMNTDSGGDGPLPP